MNYKKTICIPLILCLLFFLNACTSKEDKLAASTVETAISQIGIVTLDKRIAIEEVKRQYDALTEYQRQFVTNFSTLQSAISKLDDLQLLEENTKNDPSRTISTVDMEGIWKSNSRTRYIGISEGCVYYCGTTSGAESNTLFSTEYKIASSYSLGEYNASKQAKTGGFSDYLFLVTKSIDGQMQLFVGGDIIGGTYDKAGQNEQSSTIIINICAHTGCTNQAVTTGDSVYCSVHSKKCLECGCYIDEDAMFCIDCLAKAINSQSAESGNGSSVTLYDATLSYGSGSVVVAIDEEALDDFFDALVGKNEATLQELFDSGKLGETPRGTKCAIMKTGITRYKVKLLDGPYEGNTVWVISEAVQKK